MSAADEDFVRDLVERNRYLTLATTNGTEPWIATLEYISDGDLNLYFFSPESATHCRHLEKKDGVSVSIFDGVQPEYEAASTIRIAGVQMVATAARLVPPYPPLVADQIQAWNLPIPPYAAYRITPRRWFIPVIREGINERMEVVM